MDEHPRREGGEQRVPSLSWAADGCTTLWGGCGVLGDGLGRQVRKTSVVREVYR